MSMNFLNAALGEKRDNAWREKRIKQLTNEVSRLEKANSVLANTVAMQQRELEKITKKKNKRS